ncbi:MAG: MarR family winged helix-turn-helix transcriptional regulator [Desulfococcaceae bacterium]
MFFLKTLPTREILESYANRFPMMDVEVVAEALSMLRSASLLLRKLESYFGDHGLSQTRFLILILIDREPGKAGLTATELVHQLDISKPVVSNTIKAMVGEGLLTPLPHPSDARSRLFQLTEAGKRRLDALMPGYYELIQAHMASDDFTPSEAEVGD